MESTIATRVQSVKSSPRTHGEGHFACLGVGVGPANLSLASLLHAHDDVPSLFLDRKDSFGWHDGQQIAGATLQVSMLKDLVSLSDPTNEFSFLSYLHDQGKIYHFVNAQFDLMPRLEFRNYLEWASRRNKNVLFGEEVQSVSFEDTFVVRTDRRTLTADNISVGIGSQPWTPLPGQDWQDRSQFHVGEFVHKAVDLGGKRIAVVGGGQSGAEAFLDLISRRGGELPSQVSWVSRRRNFLPIDDSPFTNDYYMPCHSEYFFGLDRATRERVNRENILTSDGISESTLREIYQRAYQLRFIDGAPGVAALLPNRNVRHIERRAGGWDLGLAHNDRPDDGAQHLQVDVIVWATGFRTARMDFLAPLEGRLERDGSEYRIDADYAVQWDGPEQNSIFIQNAARGQRGLADPNLSLLAWRSQRIADRLRGVRSPDQLASFVEWSSQLAADELKKGA